ncbi:MAG: hypothetical protein OSJ22_02305 [Rikenellaceae bacterium]|nr:hypothetical protein [Rikenellaceae bacterium]
MNKITLIIIALCTFIATGCANDDTDLQVLRAGEPKLTSVTEAGIGFDMEATVLNGGARITIKECSVILKDIRNGRKIASVGTDGRVAIRRGASEVTVHITVNVAGGVLGGAAMLKRIDADARNISVDLRLKARKGIVPVKIDLKDVPMDELKDYLGNFL